MARNFPEPGDLVRLVWDGAMPYYEYDDEEEESAFGYAYEKFEQIKIVEDGPDWMTAVFDEWSSVGTTWFVEPGCYATIIEYGSLPGVNLPVVKVFISVVKLKDVHYFDTENWAPGFFWVSTEHIGPVEDPDEIDVNNNEG